MDTYTLIDNRITALGKLYERMDKTRDMVYLNPYKMLDFDGVTELAKVINVRPNRPAVFAHSVISSLIAGKWQTVVEGKVTDRQAHTIEGLIDSSFDQIDEELLLSRGLPTLAAWLANHVCIRGFGIGRIIVDIKKDAVDFHKCMPVDARWTPFEFGKWFAPITFRSKDEVELEYEKEIKELGISYIADSELEVRDYWDADKNETYIGKKLVRKQKNTLGYPPFVVSIAPAGFLLRDKGYMEHEGEDILYLVRGLEDEYARALSLEATIGAKIWHPPYISVTDNPDGEPAEAVPDTGEVKKFRSGEEPHLLEQADMNKASFAFRQDVGKEREDGSPIAPRAYTNAPSGAELALELETLIKVQSSRVEAMRVFREQAARMMINQVIQLGKGVSGLKVGKVGKKVPFGIEQLKDPDTYTISCKLMPDNKRQALVNLAKFAAVYDKLPLRYNLTHILEADDPDGIMREKVIQDAREADPAIGLHEMALKYVEEADEIEDDDEANAKLIQAKMLMERGVAIIRQRMQPAPLPQETKTPQVEKVKGNNQLLPQLVGGQQGVL